MTRAGSVLFLVLAGCADSASGPMTAGRVGSVDVGGPVDVVVSGQSFIADLQPGPVLSVSRDPLFGNFEGKLAKDVAQQFCAGRGSRLNAQAFGHFVAGSWVFTGGCA